MRLERTSRRTRSASSVSSMPTRRPSPPASARRRTRPARSSRATCLDIAAGDALPRGGSHTGSRRTADGDEQRHLSSGHAERVHFATELARELEEHRPQRVRDGERVGGDGTGRQLVNQVNKTVDSARGRLPCLCVVVATITRRQKSLTLIRARGWRRILRCLSSSLIPTARSSFTTRPPRRSSETRSSPPAKCRARLGQRPSRRSGKTARRSRPRAAGGRGVERRPTTWISYTGIDGIAGKSR